MLLEKRAKRLRFTKDDVISALESLFRAMLVSGHIIDEAISAHRIAFIRQTGVALAKEPYLEIEKLNLQLLFLKRLESLFTRTESYLLHDQKWCYSAEGEEWRHFDRLMSWKAFEADEPLTPQVERRIAVETERIATRTRQRLDEQRQRAAGIEYYIWRSSDDDKVRSAHAEYDDQIFRWDNPPPDGHPGAAHGCRCHAEPYPLATNEELEAEAIEPVYPEYYIVAAPRALRAIRTVADTIGKRLRRWQDERLFRRPEGVPEDWVRMSSDKGSGVKYIDPKNAGNDVRIQRGNLNNSNPMQQQNYVKWKRNGQWLDKDANPVSGRAPESHIPFKDFKFNPRVYK